MLFISENSNEKTIKITVIGAGLVGLACLVELLAKARTHPEVHFEINVIEKRELNFSRGQKIIIIDDESENKGISWIDFCKRSFFPGNKIALNEQGNLLIDGSVLNTHGTRYTLLRKMLRQQKKSSTPINISIKQLQTSLLEQIKSDQSKNILINWHLKSSVSNIELENSMLTVSSEMGSRGIFFHILINCEGEKRQTVDVINKKTVRVMQPISSYQYRELEAAETYHMAIKIKIKAPTSETYNALIKREKEKYKSDYKKQREVRDFVESSVLINGHQLTIERLPFIFDPNVYKQNFYITHWVPKYFVAGLIPREIHLIENSQEKRAVLLRWASYLLAHNFQMAPENFIIDAIESDEKALQQRANTFTSKIKAVHDPIMILPNQSVIVLLGDACMSPYYWEGISSTIGLNEALSFVECIFTEAAPAADPYQGLRTTYQEYQQFISECLSANALENIEPSCVAPERP